ncbi:MAG TPA: DUF4013 domain-containing protein [Ktedonobacterales bacterium]|nr:DUF4013 domain-containing protein [Ktedonobacterales bacterium]
MSTSLPPALPIDVGEAFGFVFRSRNWFGRLAVGALCVLFFWVFLIPAFILLGYFVETARAISRGERELPPWTNIGQKLSDGFILAVVLFIWNLPGSILSSSAGSWQCVGSSCSYVPSALAPLAPLGGLYSLLLGLLTAAIWSQFLDGGFAAAFDFRAIFRRAGLHPGMTVLVWLMVIVVGIIAAIAGVLLIVIGLLFTIPYAMAVSSHLYAQFKQRTETVATAPTG